jgi:hypothetical protein
MKSCFKFEETAFDSILNIYLTFLSRAAKASMLNFMIISRHSINTLISNGRNLSQHISLDFMLLC